MNPESDNTIVITLTCHQWGAFSPGTPAVTYTAAREILGGRGWQRVALSAGDFLAIRPDAAVGKALADWRTITELAISPSGELIRDGSRHKIAGSAWKGPREIRNLRWELAAP